MQLHSVLRKSVDSNNSIEMPTLVFIHGNSMNASFFDHQLNSDYLSSYDMLSIELPGHGNSARLDSYVLENILEILEGNLKHLKQFVIIGHSLGGHLAIQLIPLMDNQCKGLFLIGCSPIQIPINIQDAYILNEVSQKLFLKETDKQSAQKVAKSIYNQEDEILTQIINSFINTDGKFREDIGNSIIQGNYKDEFKIINSYKGELALIHGTNDLIINQSYLDALNKTNLWRKKVHQISNSGHCPHIESSKELNELLYQFLQSLL